MSGFEGRQKTYFTQELNRSLPTRSPITDSNALGLALGNTDPAFPRQQLSQSLTLASDFGAATEATKRDEACRRIPYPGTAMRPADARVGCGWWFSPDPNVPSTGAYGSRRGPMSSTLDTNIGAGEWIWDREEAYRLEGAKNMEKILTCPDIAFNQFDKARVGWCPSTNRAILTDGYGSPAFPQMMGGDCPGGNIIMEAGACPPPPSRGQGQGQGGQGQGQGIAGLCASNPLAPACLQALTNQVCSSNGSLSQSLGSGYAGTSSTFNDANKFLTQRGFTLHSGIVRDGRASVQEVLNSVQGLKSLASPNDGSRASSAAANLCFGAPFNPCPTAGSERGPFDPECVRKAALSLGYRPEGRAIDMNFLRSAGNVWTNGGLPTWEAVINDIKRWKGFADNDSGDPVLQTSAIRNVYGLSVKYPKQGCNNFGVMMYRYFFPTWDPVLFPVKGAQTHFLGRFILKNGFPHSGSTVQDMTPAGGYLKEGQRMEANFIPTQGGTYQFLIACDDFVRLQINGRVVAEVGCCGVPTPTQTITMIAGQPYSLIVDLWNGGGPWSFTIAHSVNGAAWAPIPIQQLYMPEDRRLPMFELAFNKMASANYPASGASIQDTNNIFQNLQIINANINQLNGRQCMNVTGPASGIFNYATYNQGIRLRAMKSITMMIQINSVNNGGGGVTPSVLSFFNLPDTNTSAFPRRGWSPNLVKSYFARVNNFSIVTNGSTIFPIQTGSAGSHMIPPIGQWFHLAFVWDDNFVGYTMYINGTPGIRVALNASSPQLIMEQIRIGCDNELEGQSWKGGIAWFRAFDYRLSDELIALDKDDAWASL